MSLMQKSDASETDGKYLLSNQVERILCSAIYYFFYTNSTEYHIIEELQYSKSRMCSMINECLFLNFLFVKKRHLSFPFSKTLQTAGSK